MSPEKKYDGVGEDALRLNCWVVVNGEVQNHVCGKRKIAEII